jgi:hypothetical protein
MTKINKTALKNQAHEYDLNLSKAALDLMSQSDVDREQSETYIEKAADVAKVFGVKTIKDTHVRFVMDVDAECASVESGGGKTTQKMVKEQAHDLGFNVSKSSLPLLTALDRNQSTMVVDLSAKLVSMKGGKTLQDQYVALVIDLLKRCEEE